MQVVMNGFLRIFNFKKIVFSVAGKIAAAEAATVAAAASCDAVKIILHVKNKNKLL